MQAQQDSSCSRLEIHICWKKTINIYTIDLKFLISEIFSFWIFFFFVKFLIYEVFSEVIYALTENGIGLLADKIRDTKMIVHIQGQRHRSLSGYKCACNIEVETS